MVILRRLLRWSSIACLAAACAGAPATPSPLPEPSPENTRPAPTPTALVQPTPTPRPQPTTPPTRTPRPAASPTAAERDRVITVGEYFFDPQVMTVTVGTTVKWVGVGDRVHSMIVVEGPSEWKGEVGDMGSPPFELTFTEPGEYYYTCDVHPSSMDGWIVVVGED
jgi:plastocyanin